MDECCYLEAGGFAVNELFFAALLPSGITCRLQGGLIRGQALLGATEHAPPPRMANLLTPPIIKVDAQIHQPPRAGEHTSRILSTDCYVRGTKAERQEFRLSAR